MAREFTRAQKLASAIVQDTTLDGKEADHIVPVSHGGETVVENCQILESHINKSKSDKHWELREWQSRFVNKWDQRESDRPFLLVAIPGSGKTVASLTVICNWMMAGPDRRVIIVVPSDNLKLQWRDEAVAFGLQLQTREFGTDFKDGFQGAVVSYHAVSRQPLVFRKLCSVAPTMVVFDEIHHCGDDKSFGKGIKEAFALAKEKLLLSGTPWKTDGEAIPFVRYDGEGYPVPDERYDYPDALQDQVVRFLVFTHAGGDILYDDRTESVNASITDEEASQRLRKVLRPDGDFVRGQIRDAHRKLIECRRVIPDAAAIAACIDKSHAERIANVIAQETGRFPSVIVSDTEIANDDVNRFRDGTSEWLVAVRQVSEGTDIKRLQVLCYLTNYATEVFFRQIIGRVSRVRGLEDFEGYVYLPADPRLIRFSRSIDNAQMQAIREECERKSRDPNDDDRPLIVEPFSTQHAGIDLVLIGNREYSNNDALIIERAAESAGISMDKAARVFEFYKSASVTTRQPKQTKEKSLEEQESELRTECQRLAYWFARQMKLEVWDVHLRFPKKQEHMSLEELKQKRQTLSKWISEQR